ncbi:MAG: tripartite tricarboxylate transporter permease [Planctomycetes bacterium]|nr:tripartite tricarboxylate transporter permease [Planctomycetota bacterium]
MVGAMTTALGTLCTVESLLFINFGLAVGIIFGALPGLTATMGVALFLPVTFSLDPLPGILLLLGVYCGGIYGGSITAILIKTPGTPASAATVLDGYTMAANGHPGKALDVALVASTIGGVISAGVLLFLAPQVARAALRFGSPERFMLAMFGLSIIATISGRQIFKGIIAASIGLFVGCIGLDPIEGLPRFTFGMNDMMAGVDITPALIGLFAISEIFNKVYMGDVTISEKNRTFAKESMSLAEVRACGKDIVKSSLIGTVIGAIPGTGAAIASFLSYMEARRTSRTPEKFGTGHINGIAAPEAGNNGVTGATLIPLLTLGIPGDSVTAIMLGALMMKGLTPGPQLFRTQAVLMYTIMIGLIFVNVFMFFQGKLFLRLFVNVSKIPTTLLSTILVVLCVIGGFSGNNSLFDVFLMIGFAVVGYLFLKLNMPPVPMLLALILGPMAEENLRKSLLLSKGSWTIFLTKPISLVFFIITVLAVSFPIVMNYYRGRKARRPAEKDTPSP